jgi:glucosamine-6-phosphate deaminase
MSTPTSLPEGRPRVLVYPTAEEAGRAAAHHVASEIRLRQAEHPALRMMVAAAASQRGMLHTLRREPGIHWDTITAFHMDEYLGLPQDASQRFGQWLRAAFFDHVPLGAVNLIRTDGDIRQCADEYAQLLAAEPLDLVCFGIGVNGHLAFNDPPVADFDDPADVKVVELDEVCRQQQVDDGAFPTLQDVPRRAFTVTVPRLLRAHTLIGTVTGPSKHAAVRAALTGPETTGCPATVLRRHPRCTVYLDKEAAGDLR